MSEIVCVLIALGISLVIGLILLITDLFGIGKILYDIGFPKILILPIKIACIFLIFIFSYDAIYKYAKADYYDVYYTTKVELNRYAEIDDSPHGKEIGKVPVDTVLNVRHFTAKDSITWLESYMLTPKGTPEKLLLLFLKKLTEEMLENQMSIMTIMTLAGLLVLIMKKLIKKMNRLKK